MNQGHEVLKRLVDGYRQTILIGTACQSGLFDMLAENPKTAESIAKDRGWHSNIVRRLLRGLEVLDLVHSQTHAGSISPIYTLTDAGQSFTRLKDDPINLYSRLTLEQYLPGWLSMITSLDGTKTPFAKQFGECVWDYRRSNKSAGDLFAAWLNRQTDEHVSAIIEAIDAAAVQRVIDIGGGRGSLLRALLTRYPNLHGVLADQREVVSRARTLPDWDTFHGRVEFEEINFFESLPTGLDLYLLKSVLHDWGDEDAIALLKVLCNSMGTTSKLIVVERLIPESPQHDPATIWLDLHMLCITGGQERTLKEYHALFREAGLAASRVIQTNGPFYLLEAVRS
jgi:O-methyltransferase domain/Dimerisation domain